MKNIIISACTLAAIVAPAFAVEGWMTELPTALQQAANENKSVLVDFNGSDWCGPCIMLKKMVLNTPAFEAYAKDKFILVDIDLPHGDKLSKEQKEINQKLAEQYGVTGYPTILVLDKDGFVLGGFTGSTDQIELVKNILDEAIANGPAIYAALEEAKGLEGEAKIMALVKAYNNVSFGGRDYNLALRKQIIDLDTDDITGLRAEEKAKKAAAKDRAAANAARHALSAAAVQRLYDLPLEERPAALEKFITDSSIPENERNTLYWVKIEDMMNHCETILELEALKAAMTKFDETSTNAITKGKLNDYLKYFNNTPSSEVLDYLKRRAAVNKAICIKIKPEFITPEKK